MSTGDRLTANGAGKVPVKEVGPVSCTSKRNFEAIYEFTDELKTQHLQGMRGY